MNKILLSVLLIALAACQQDQSTTTPLSHQTTKKYSQAKNLSGVVSNAKGRVATGQITVTDVNEQSIASAEVNEHGQYQVEVPANTELPIILNFQHEEEKFIAVVIDPALSKYDINPLTTTIAKKAKEMGGYTRANLVMAAENSVHVPDANKTSTGFRGDPTTQYGGWH